MRQVARVVGEVGVHLEDALGAHVEGVAKAGDVGLAQALLAGAVEDRDVGHLRREVVGDLSRAVGRGVVDDERVKPDAVAVRDFADPGHGVTQVLGLVVGGKDDDVHADEYIAAARGLRPRRPS